MSEQLGVNGWLDLKVSEPEDGRSTVEMSGELDAHTAPSFSRVIERLREEGVADVRLDMSELTFLDSTGLQALVEQAEAVRTDGGSVALVAPTESVRRVLHIADLTHTFVIE